MGETPFGTCLPLTDGRGAIGILLRLVHGFCQALRLVERGFEHGARGVTDDGSAVATFALREPVAKGPRALARRARRTSSTSRRSARSRSMRSTPRLQASGRARRAVGSLCPEYRVQLAALGRTGVTLVRFLPLLALVHILAEHLRVIVAARARVAEGLEAVVAVVISA
jgi:hypothetical protein